MSTFDLDKWMSYTARRMWKRASRLPAFDGSELSAELTIPACAFDDDRTRTRLIFTRDVGMHTGGWWKNPDFERCWHLSLSPFPAMVLTPEQVADPTSETWRRWCLAFFGEEVRRTWFEPAYSPHGKTRGVEHWRLFADEHWQPITPRGEVYSRELTERGWRSWSEVVAAEVATAQAILEEVLKP